MENISALSESQRVALFLKLVYEQLQKGTRCKIRTLITQLGIPDVIPALLIEKKILQRLDVTNYKWIDRNHS